MNVASLLAGRYERVDRVLKFAATGASGIPVDFGIVALVYSLGASWLLANVAGYVVAVTWNFSWNYLWTWERPDGSIARMYRQYLGADIPLFFVRALIVGALIDVAEVPVLLSTLVGILVVAAATFVLAELVIFAEEGAADA